MCILILREVKLAGIRCFLTELDGFKFLKRLEYLDQGVRSIWITFKLALIYICLNIDLEGERILAEQVDDHEEITLEKCLICGQIGMWQSLIIILGLHLNNFQSVLLSWIRACSAHCFLFTQVIFYL